MEGLPGSRQLLTKSRGSLQKRLVVCLPLLPLASSCNLGHGGRRHLETSSVRTGVGFVWVQGYFSHQLSSPLETVGQVVTVKEVGGIELQL